MGLRRAAVAIALSGCSMTVMNRAPKHDPGIRPIECSSSRAAPIVDTVFALAATSLTAKIVYEVEQVPASEKHGVASPVIVLIPLVLLPLMLAYGGSAIAGYAAAERCERYRGKPPPFQDAPPAPFTITSL
jgi:hypothetical protein